MPIGTAVRYLKKGEWQKAHAIVQQGTLDEMIRCPANDYVTRFINAQRLPGVEAKEVATS